MIPSKIEYILLRLVRRFVFTTGFLERFGFLLPYYRVNCNQFDPRTVVDDYERRLGTLRVPLAEKRVVEIGSGATNSTSYELAARGCSKVYAVEPYARFAGATDRRLLTSIAEAHGSAPGAIGAKVERLVDVQEVPASSIDIVVSHSVLEHVAHPERLFIALRDVLTAKGVMIHIVDYRDHFFKYPFHVLLFSKKTWHRWLNPGDLPGWRMSQHLHMLEAAGYAVTCDEVTRDPEHFNAIKHAIAADYDRGDPYLDVIRSTLVALKK